MGRECQQYLPITACSLGYRSGYSGSAPYGELSFSPTLPTTGSEIVNVRLSSALVDELDAKAEAEGTTRKVTRALAQAGYHVPAQDLEDRTPRRRRRAG